MKTLILLIATLFTSVSYAQLTADSPPGPMEVVVVTASRTEVLAAARHEWFEALAHRAEIRRARFEARMRFWRKYHQDRSSNCAHSSNKLLSSYIPRLCHRTKGS